MMMYVLPDAKHIALTTKQDTQIRNMHDKITHIQQIRYMIVRMYHNRITCMGVGSDRQGMASAVTWKLALDMGRYSNKCCCQRYSTAFVLTNSKMFARAFGARTLYVKMHLTGHRNCEIVSFAPLARQPLVCTVSALGFRILWGNFSGQNMQEKR